MVHYVILYIYIIIFLYYYHYYYYLHRIYIRLHYSCQAAQDPWYPYNNDTWASWVGSRARSRERGVISQFFAILYILLYFQLLCVSFQDFNANFNLNLNPEHLHWIVETTVTLKDSETVIQGKCSWEGLAPYDISFHEMHPCSGSLMVWQSAPKSGS